MRLVFAALALTSISAPVHAQNATTQASQDTLADAIASALEDNPSLMAQRSTRAVADETLEQARSQLRPQLGLSGSYGTQEQEIGRSFSAGGRTFPLDGRSERATVGLEARQTLYAGGSLAALRRQAQAGVAGAEAELSAFEQQVILAVVEAYLDVRRAEAELQIRETNVASLGQQVQAASDRFDVGEVTLTDVAQARSRRAGSEADLAAARANLAAARASYQDVVGRPAIQLATPPPLPQTPESVDVAIAGAMADNLDLAAARAAETAASEGVSVARGGLRPRVGLVGSAGLIETYQDDTFRDTNVGLSAEVSIPLYQGGLAGSRTRAARLEADRARFQRLAVERAVAARASTAWHAVIAAREGIAASRSRVAAAEVALEGAEQELSVGTRITLDVLDQERELLDAQLGLIDAERAAYLAIHQLFAAMGRLSPELVSR